MPLFNARRAPTSEEMQANIAKAVEGLRNAVAADEQNGAAERYRLRQSRPARPPILDTVEQWDWSEQKKAEYRQEYAKAFDQWTRHILLADPSVMTPEDMKNLPSAALHWQRREKEIRAAGSAAQQRLDAAAAAKQPANPLDLAAVQEAASLDVL